MKIKIKRNDIIWLLTVVLFASFYIFESFTFGKYILAVISILIFVLSAGAKNNHLKFRMEPYHIFVILFALFCLTSSLWAWDSSAAVSKSITIFQILVCFSLIYMHYETQQNIDDLISAIMWAGYAVSIYSFFAYGGISTVLQMATGGIRLDNDFSNVNSIGMLAAIACVIQVYKNIYDKFSWSSLLIIPAIIIIAATQSRKAIVMLAVGILMVLILKNLNNKKFFTSLGKIVFTLMVAIILFIVISKMEIFAGLNERMEAMLSPFTGEGKLDHSAWLRGEYRKIGWEQFLKTPIGGIGIGSSGVLLVKAGQRNTYLHNNFVELLACGGVIGFLLYYSIYFYLFYQLLKYLKYDKQRCNICIVLLILLFVMDYGAVSYYSKSQYFYFMMYFLEVRNLRKLTVEKEKDYEFQKNILRRKKYLNNPSYRFLGNRKCNNLLKE